MATLSQAVRAKTANQTSFEQASRTAVRLERVSPDYAQAKVQLQAVLLPLVCRIIRAAAAARLTDVMLDPLGYYVCTAQPRAPALCKLHSYYASDVKLANEAIQAYLRSQHTKAAGMGFGWVGDWTATVGEFYPRRDDKNSPPGKLTDDDQLLFAFGEDVHGGLVERLLERLEADTKRATELVREIRAKGF